MKEKIVLIIAYILFINVDSYAQLIWDHNIHTNKSSISLEWIKPKFDARLDENDKISYFSSAVFLQGYFPIGYGFAVVGDIPISHWEFKDGDGIDTQKPHTTIGNIYIGGSYRFKKVFNDRLIPSLELGTRLPTMPDPEFPNKQGLFSGYVSSIDRREAYTLNILPIIGIINAEYIINSVAIFRVRGGGSYWIDRDSFYQQNQLYLIQGVQFYFSTPELSGNFGLTGKYNVAPSDASLSRDDVTQIRVGVSKNFNLWDIEVFMRSPMKNGTLIEAAYGFKIKYKF